MRRTAEDIVEIGRDLIAVQDRLGRGGFLDWIKAEFDMSQSAAYRFIGVAKRFGDVLPNLGSSGPSIIYELAAPSTPDEVVTKATEKAAAGETVTLAEVQRLKAALVNARNSAGEAGFTSSPQQE